MGAKTEEHIDRIISTAADMIISQLEEHRDGLADALGRNGELSVSIAFKAVRDGSATVIGSKVSFVKEKVTDEKKWMISDQEPLPFDPRGTGGEQAC